VLEGLENFETLQVVKMKENDSKKKVAKEFKE
jgi:hypothetical protein